MVGIGGDVCPSNLASHPRGLWILGLTETWERFSYYGVRALLVLYLTSGALTPERFGPVLGSKFVLAVFGTPHSDAEVQALSSQINQWYSGLAFCSPLLGGVIADRLLGIHRTCILGGLMMAAAHACMAFDRLFLIGLLLLVLGNGAFKPTISAQLSQLYISPAHSALREAGFALFHLAINAGALLAPVTCGILQQKMGFHAGFGAAGVGMLVALAIYLGGSHHLPDERRPWRKAHGSDVELEDLHAVEECGGKHELAALTPPCSSGSSGSGSSLILSTGEDSGLTAGGLTASGGAALSGRGGLTCGPSTAAAMGGMAEGAAEVHRPSMSCAASTGICDGSSDEGSPRAPSATPAHRGGSGLGRWPARQAAALSGICMLVLPYWACWDQMSNTVPLYYEKLVTRTLWGVHVPTAALQSISPIFTVLLLPYFSNRWARRARSGIDNSAASKLAVGVLLQATSWLLMAASAVGSHRHAKASLHWPLLANLLYTVGHIHVGPVGLSLATRCAPLAAQSSAVGVWMLFGGIGGVLAGPLGTYYSIWEPPRFFTALALLAASCSVGILVLVPRLELIARGLDVGLDDQAAGGWR